MQQPTNDDRFNFINSVSQKNVIEMEKILEQILIDYTKNRLIKYHVISDGLGCVALDRKNKNKFIFRPVWKFAALLTLPQVAQVINDQEIFKDTNNLPLVITEASVYYSEALERTKLFIEQLAAQEKE